MIEILLSLAIAASDSSCVLRQMVVEAEGEPVSGMSEVAWVIRNRSEKTGMTNCEVVGAKGQFGDRDVGFSLAVALKALEAFSMHERCDGATYFDVSENTWSSGLEVKCQIGRHVFYGDR